ncbi:putative phosphoglycan beta 1,3 galactosyltransferase [Leishmania major strain Friedlin]|uniref:Putative phosphoglycan beta 1,3 galactosyltransferase n=1 Tax=Leishmania major TaxID=5664 RepID=Q4QFJ3_LEIMA|nr:putative phosphoglycan beta 1,3 galactosyltransferase [Leishmania major strain Friedlin]CAG9571336.1 phosphoglycan_beta_1_-3_galactosyltransferase_-_putative [Leishmania major strain Friedlin]CAJ03215.1 putative phosphoglycan beta 1,3 galactosyltransferase [Leishmania major strain Friedlin]|eukprot:XP_001687741.1 putative phosphoglycan beta 1,3 galactosyltransferase [Leishmania major strain Friedlin]
MMDNCVDGGTGGDGSSHLRRSTTAEPRYGVCRRGDGDDDDYDKGRSVSVLSRLLMTLGGFSWSAPTQEGGGGRAPTTTAAATTHRRRRGMVTARTLLSDGARICFTFLFCCCCCPFTKKLLGETTRRRNSVIVATENTAENAMLVIRRTWERHRGLLVTFASAYVFLLWWVGLPLAQTAVVSLLESEELFIARLQYVGLPDALHPPTHPMAVLLQQLAVPPALMSLRRVSVLPRNGGRGGAAEANPDASEGMSKSVRQQLFDRYRTRSAALAMEGLRLSYTQRHPRLFFIRSSRTLTASQVPSWTLHVVEDGCAECLQGQGYAEAVKGMAVELDQTSPRTAEDDSVSRAAPSQVQGAVFATSNAPLGRIGPMLLAMASVTDDVEVAAELRKWRWLAPVRASEVRKDSPRAPRGSFKCASSKPYLAVLGIPSTDQPARVALREAQRQTWFTYHEVARTETGFEGALLPLYIFGAVEWPAPTRQPTGAPVTPSARDDGEGTVRGGGKAAGKPARLDAAYVSIDTQRLSTDPSLLLPRIDELTAAVELRTATLAAAAGATIAADQDAPLLEMPTVTQRRRRMTLRPSWRNERSTDSPCDAIVDQTVRMTAASATPPSVPLLQVAQHLSLPVAPLVAAPARFVCYASSALWQEALERRDSLWIDMLTDRRPATGKTVGGEGKWGLRVEVGMSQKLILWLMYAYCTFPEVPFIMKGDDDTYIKVPQYLSDIRYLQRGRKTRVPPPHDVDTEHATVENAQLVKSTEECVYWGSMRRWNGEVYFSAGMLLLLHRRLVQTVVEVRTEFNNDVLYLAAADYSAAYAHSYYASMMDHEDVMLGKLLMERRFRADRLCPFRRHWYVWEDLQRFHDLHRGRVRNVTWASVALHRCRPADAHYLHYFFAQEHRYSGSGVAAERSAEGGQEGDAIPRNERAERAARQAAQSWVADRLRPVLQASGNVAERAARKFDAAALTTAEEGAGWSSLPDVLWALQRDCSVHTPPYLSTRDGVAIDDVEYVPFSDGVLVLNGWKARILL